MIWMFLIGVVFVVGLLCVFVFEYRRQHLHVWPVFGIMSIVKGVLK